MREDERLLEALGAVAREGRDSADELDRLLGRLTHGELAPEMLAQLEEQAREDAGLALQLDAHRPLGPALRDRIAEGIIVALQPRAVRPPGMRWIRRVAYVCLPAAAAAVLFVGLRTETPVVPLPPYEIALRGDSRDRAPPVPFTGPVTLSPGSRFELVLRPTQGTSGPVAARARLLLGDRPVPLTAPIQVAGSGAVRIEGTRHEIFGDRVGPVILQVAVGHPEQLEVAFVSDQSSGQGWQRFDAHVHLLPPP